MRPIWTRPCPRSSTRAAVAALISASREALAGIGALVEARRQEGKVRLCHGDLHLRNICLLDGRPDPFRLHRVQPGHGLHRRALRSLLPAHGSGPSRASRTGQYRLQPLLRSGGRGGGRRCAAALSLAACRHPGPCRCRRPAGQAAGAARGIDRRGPRLSRSRPGSPAARHAATHRHRRPQRHRQVDARLWAGTTSRRRARGPGAAQRRAAQAPDGHGAGEPAAGRGLWRGRDPLGLWPARRGGGPAAARRMQRRPRCRLPAPGGADRGGSAGPRSPG